MWTAKDDQPSNEPGCSSTNTEVVLVDCQGLTPASTPPNIANLNITKSSRVHIGPKFINVTQNLQNTEVVKGHFLGLGLISPKGARQLRCSVAVFVCWAFLVAVGLVVYLVFVGLPRQQIRLDIGLNMPWYLRRGDWQAMPPYGVDFLGLPLTYVIIGHSAGNFCQQRFDCIEQILSIQQDHLQRRLNDIGPNFLVGGSGFVFEGRGANVRGAVVAYWNARSITIMFMGNYVTDLPNQQQFDHVNILLDVLVKDRVLVANYTLYAQCQVQPETFSPGRHVLAHMENFANWNSYNLDACLNR